MSDEPLPLEVEAIALAALGKRVKEQENLTRAVIAGDYHAGDKRTFRSPVDGSKLGQVYRTDPNPSWTVTDREALHAFLRADPANLEEVAEIDDMPAAVEALKECAPHVLALVQRVSGQAVTDAVERAKAGQAIPGVERRKPEGSLTVKADPNATDAIAGLIAAGRLTWDGRRVLEQSDDTDTSRRTA